MVLFRSGVKQVGSNRALSREKIANEVTNKN